MKRILHHFLWLGRRFRFVLLPYALLWGALTTASWLLPAGEIPATVFWVVPVLLLLWACLMLAEAVLADSGVGTDAFWKTRPPRWREIWCSQLMFLLCPLAGPPLLGWLVNGLLLHNTAAQWAGGSVDLLFILCPLFFAGGVASTVRGKYSAVFTCLLLLFLLGVAWMETFSPMRHDIWSLEVTYSRQWVFRLLLLAFTVTVIMLWTWAVHLRRPQAPEIVVLSGVALVTAPLSGMLIWPVVRDWPPGDVTALQAEWPAEGPLPPDAQEAGEVVLRNVPEESAAILSQTDLSMPDVMERYIDIQRDYGWVPFFSLTSSGWPSDANPDSLYIEVADKKLKSLVPGNTRWYKGSGYIEWPPSITLYPQRYSAVRDERKRGHARKVEFPIERRPITTRLEGIAKGSFFTAARLVTLPLEEGASGAGNGTHLRIRSLERRDTRLDISMEARLAGGLEPVPPGGFAGRDPARHYGVPVLYFPAVPMAVLLSEAPREWEFRSWQVRIRQYVLEVEMPEPERAAGLRFTPEILRGATVMLCAAVNGGDFIVHPPKEKKTFFAHPALAEAGDTGWMLDHLDTSGISARLKALGPRAIPSLLRYPWEKAGPPLDTEKFRRLEPELRLADYLPDLAQAVSRDPRWMDTAWRNGLAGKLGDTALSMLRETHLPLPESLVVAAAEKAGEADYPALRLHALQAVSMAKPDTDPSGVSPDAVLWARLRALPGFDWHGTVLTKWRRVFMESGFDTKFPPELQTAAILAGDSDALNTFLDTEPPAAPPEVAALIDGLPEDEASRPAWFRKHRGYFILDAVSGRYRLPPSR